MKKILLVLLLILATSVNAQNSPVKFTRFKLSWFNVLGFTGGGDGQTLKLKFKNQSGKQIKYINVKYYAINSVNDITADKFNRSKFVVNCTGPFDDGDTKSLQVDIALFHPNLLIAYPYKVDIDYMDGECQEVEITKNNISSFFPKINYIKIGNI